MTIAFFGVASSPADDAAQTDAAARSVTPPASMQAGDLVYVRVLWRSTTGTLSISDAGGQSWSAVGAQFTVGTAAVARDYWCRFNGTWSANPSWQCDTPGTLPFSIVMDVHRPTSGSNTWILDQARTTSNFNTPASPYNVQATGHTTIGSSTVTIATWFVGDDDSWTLSGTPAGWTNQGGIAQWRNTAGQDLCISSAYKIQSSPGATGDPINTQGANGPDGGRWFMATFREQSSGVTISDAADERYYHGETGIVVTGTSFGAAHTGSADIIISPTDNIADGSAVTQTQTAWGDTSVTFTANLSSFGFFTTLYLFVKNSSGSANASGYPIKREARFRITEDIDNGGSPWASQSSIQYRIVAAADGLNGTPLLSGASETTDGSAILQTSYYTLTEGASLVPGSGASSRVLISLFQDNATIGNTRGTTVSYLPTYE